MEKDFFENQLLFAMDIDAEDFWVGDSVNDSSCLWLAGQLDTESYLDQFAEFGDVDYHIERMIKIWEYWGLI